MEMVLGYGVVVKVLGYAPQKPAGALTSPALSRAF
jgi:hypothetical protein